MKQWLMIKLIVSERLMLTWIPNEKKPTETEMPFKMSLPALEVVTLTTSGVVSAGNFVTITIESF